MEEKTRDKSMDFLKGLAIYLVIHAHAISHVVLAPGWNNPIFKVINMFHMALFIFIAGYFFKANDNLINYTIKKFKTLIIPAISMVILTYLVLVNFKETHGVERYKLMNLLINEYWFVKAVFICSIMTFVITKYLKKDWLLFLPIPFLIVKAVEIPYFVNYMYFFFVLGYLYKKYNNTMEFIFSKKIIYFMPIICMLLFVVVFFHWNAHTYMYKSCDIYNFWERPVTVLLNTAKRYIGGLSAIIALLIIVKKMPQKYFYLDKIGQNTLGIYLLQNMILRIYDVISLRYWPELSFNPILYNLVIVPIVAIVVLIFSNTTVELLKKNTYTKKIFLGIWK